MCNLYMLNKDGFIGKLYGADMTAVAWFGQIAIMFNGLTLQDTTVGTLQIGG